MMKMEASTEKLRQDLKDVPVGMGENLGEAEASADMKTRTQAAALMAVMAVVDQMIQDPTSRLST